MTELATSLLHEESPSTSGGDDQSICDRKVRPTSPMDAAEPELDSRSHGETFRPETLGETTLAIEKSKDRFVTKFPIPRVKPLETSFVALQKWEGAVLEVSDDKFFARLVDLRNEDEPDEEAEVPLEEVSPHDMDLVKPGAVFYWSIGYLTQADGQKRRVSQIRFRRLPVWSEQEIEAARQRSKELSELLGI